MKVPRRKTEIPVRKDSIYNRCLIRIVQMSNAAGKELVWEEVDRLVLEVSRKYVPQENNLDSIIEHITTNSVYGFTDDIPF